MVEAVERDRLIEAREGAATTTTTTSTSASSSGDSLVTSGSTASSVSPRVWPPLVDEAPNWPANGNVDKKAGTEDEDGKATARRLFHWGPMVAMFIITYISAVTTYFTMMWWPLTTPSGALHFLFFGFWNYMTVMNLVRASSSGAGLVPKAWKPPKASDESRLQWCSPCGGYKAPRSHHCSKCGRCTMKMDHHCPWINNCVGHRNHAWFVRFLSFAIVGCLHAIVIHIICFYHAIHIKPPIAPARRLEIHEELKELEGWGLSHPLSLLLFYSREVAGWYMQFDNSQPMILLSFWSLIALVAASAFAFGVTIGLSGLLFIQIRYIKNNKTGIEDYIDSKALTRRDEDEDDISSGSTDTAWIYPYDLGWKRNFREVLCSWDGTTVGNGIWWPVVQGCDQFTLTMEQLRQKRLKRSHARVVEITGDFAGGYFGSCKMGCKLFFCQPINEESRVKVTTSEEWVVTRGQKLWLYGHKRGNEKMKGWFPRSLASLMPDRPAYDDDDVIDQKKKTVAAEAGSTEKE